MNETQVKELFGTVVAGAQTRLPDIDLAVTAGRRRRRLRAAAALSSVVVVALLLVGLVVAATPRTSPPPPVVGPTSAPSASASASQTAQAAKVSVKDWGDEVLASLPYRDQLTQASYFAQPALFVPSSKDTASADLSTAVRTYASFQYTDAGRTTGLFIRVDAKNAYDGYAGSPRVILLGNDLLAQYAPPTPTWRDTPQGLVMITSGVEELDNKHHQAAYIQAVNLRPSGQLVRVVSWGTAFSRTGDVLPGPGAPGMQGQVDRLVATATGIPEPPIVADAKGAGEYGPTPNPNMYPPTPVSSPTAASAIRIEKSGRSFVIGSGATMTVTPDKACVSVAGRSTCAPGYTHGGERDVSKVVVPLGSGGQVVVLGRHPLSAAEASSIVVTIDGRSTVATLVKLGANDEHLAYYAVVRGSPTSDPTVEVFNHDGHLYAQNKGA